MPSQFYYRRSADRYAELCASPPALHTPRPMPAPGPEHYQHLAETKRREAASILRHVRRSDFGPGPQFARRQAEDLYREADDLDARAAALGGDQ